jgi:hypothetical protein
VFDRTRGIQIFSCAAAFLVCLLACERIPINTLQASETIQDAKIRVSPKWEAGQVLRYEQTKERTRKQGELTKLSGKSRTEITLTVKNVTPQAVVVEWALGETKLEDPQQQSNPLVQQMANVVRGYRIELELDPEDATILGVRNWQQLQETSRQVVDLLVADLSKNQTPADAISAVRKQMEGMFATKESIEQNFTREPQLFFLTMGREFDPRNPASYEDKLPNPLGGEPFPAHGQFVVKTWDEAQKRLVVDWSQKVDPEQASAILERTLQAIAKNAGRPAPSPSAVGQISISDAGSFTLDTATGWIVELRHTRTNEAGSNQQSDTLTFKRMP